MSSSGGLPYCKYLWSVISGTTCRCEKKLVEEEIQEATPLLRDGLLYFKKFTEDSLKTITKNDPPKMYDFVSKLGALLNLDATITWEIVQNFMAYEYRNSAEAFASHLTDLTSMKALIADIWSFYYSERITLIKCLKLMVEYKDNDAHPNQKEFSKFFDEVCLGDLLVSVMNQIEALKFIDPPLRSQLCTEDHLHYLYNTSLIEMRELLHVLTMILSDVHISESNKTNFGKLYESIGGEPKRLTSTKSHEEKAAIFKKIEEIQYSQAALLLVVVDVSKHTNIDNWIKTIRNSSELKFVRDSAPHDGPFLLAWMLANYAIEPDNQDILNQFKLFGLKAIKLNVFHYLRGLLNSEIVQDDTYYAEVVRNSVYNMFTLLSVFVDKERMSSLDGIFHATAALLQYPEVADKFWNEQEDELRTIYQCAIELFPYNFSPLTIIATGLANASESSAQKIATELDHLPSLTIEVPRQRDHRSLRPYERECIIHKNTFTIPDRCPGEVLHIISNTREIILFKTKANYWDALHHRIEQLFLKAGGGVTHISGTEEDILNSVSEGLKLLVALLSKDIDIVGSIIIPTELSFDIINKFSYPVLPLKVYKIVTECMRIASKLVLKYPEEILSRMQAGVYPRFNNWYQKALDFAEAISFDGGLVASWLSGIDTIEHTYPILNAYLDTLSNYLIVKHNKEAMYTIEIPGMVFLLQGVLPKLDSWYFESESERIDLWLKSMFCLHRALESALPKDDIRNELQLVVAYSLLYLEPRHAILKLIRTGEKTLHNQMLTETNWIFGKGFKVIKSVQLALSVVNRLLMFRKSLGLELTDRSPLEIALYTSPRVPNALLIVPTIVNYLYVWFSPSLQAMAVRLLKKFAEGFSMSLLVCMGMDGTAIRETFASRLMSPTCAVEVKVAILELVAVCLEKQPGLTEALFNIMHQAERKRTFPRRDEEFHTEGCNQFLDQYLKRIYNEEEIVEDSLYDSTMTLIRAMWYHKNEILVNFFRKRENFWTYLFAPLFKDLMIGAKGYSQLLDVITLELFKNSLLENDYSINLKKLLDKSQSHWKKLAEYILKPILINEEQGNYKKLQPLYQTNLESWYNFIVTLTDERVAKHYHIDVLQAHLITELTLDSLLEHIKYPKDQDVGKIMMLLASLSLRCVTSWKQMCVGDSQAFKSRLTQLTQEIAQSYRGYGKYLRQTLISLLLGSVQLVKCTLADDIASLEYLLGYSCTIATGELEELREATVKMEQRKQQQMLEIRRTEDKAASQENTEGNEVENLKGIRESLPATLAISMVTQLLRSSVDHNPSKHCRKPTCLQLRQMIPELMNCVVMTLQKYSFSRFSSVALSLLGVIARSAYVPNPIDETAVTKMWLSLIPPMEIENSMLDSLYDDRPSGQWRCQDWWPIYTLGLEFLLGFVSSEMPTIYLNIIVKFFNSHEQQLMVASTLLRHTADLIAADLVQSLVSLIYSTATQPVLWYSVQPKIRETLIKCMYLVYDSTVNLLLRPRILKFIIDGISVSSAEELESCDEKLPSGELKLLMNKLIVINTTCALSFIYFSPRLNTLVDTIYTQNFWYTPMAEINFSPPRMCISSGPRLTYGTIISSAQLFTQALYSRFQHGVNIPTSQPSKDDKIEPPRKDTERTDVLRKMHHTSKDIRRIIHALPGTSRSSGILNLPVLTSPRLVRRPYDPLICENTVLSSVISSALAPGRHIAKGSGSSASTTGNGSPVVAKSHANKTSDPWFASMEENNTRLALES
ncbi:nucleoporin Nup188 isoform X2 [Prorops nasuta]|uniref:nucleoporin Nup188 isoform X2 n=1 Tax=Prorops nasuta TaxID=863751 RepID=UPI0034CE78A7